LARSRVTNYATIACVARATVLIYYIPTGMSIIIFKNIVTRL